MASVLKRLTRHRYTQAFLAWLVGAYLAFALRTTRWRLEGAEHIARHADGIPAIAAFWHECLPSMPQLWRMARGQGARGSVHVLVSRHRDGRFIGYVVRRFGIGVVHGSSSRGGASGLRTLLGLLADGGHVAITPDGPRGPRREAAPGVAQLAALSGVAVLPCAAHMTSRLILKTWDRMMLPLPFGRGVVVCGAPIVVTRSDWQAAVPAIEAALTGVSEEAARLCAR
ncbi:MAG: lysophospholipid acyltransferase family protein [Rhodospirillales bacterium]|nr:lysophospholipid acyltransferase family protein [Rhodospirillales bacterium]